MITNVLKTVKGECSLNPTKYVQYPYPPNRGNITEAKLNTKKNPHISVIVVNSGPDARAGSVRIPLKISGTKPPKLTATNVFAASDTPTTKPR
jgi:hypothetical protein